MSTYYSEAFDDTKEMQRLLRQVFDHGLCTDYIVRTHSQAKMKMVAEFFDQMVEWHMPLLDEMTSLGAVQDWLDTAEGRKHILEARGRDG